MTAKNRKKKEKRNKTHPKTPLSNNQSLRRDWSRPLYTFTTAAIVTLTCSTSQQQKSNQSPALSCHPPPLPHSTTVGPFRSLCRNEISRSIAFSLVRHSTSTYSFICRALSSPSYLSYQNNNNNYFSSGHFSLLPSLLPSYPLFLPFPVIFSSFLVFKADVQ
ncbi:MAG: hypothetical protein JOS17DRAFT_160850 [Linnemannia elongata]|nr:MAG: hypothetical protein JOS17DRAFT_160850 [Linnemannia elongata]